MTHIQAPGQTLFQQHMSLPDRPGTLARGHGRPRRPRSRAVPGFPREQDLEDIFHCVELLPPFKMNLYIAPHLDRWTVGHTRKDRTRGHSRVWLRAMRPSKCPSVQASRRPGDSGHSEGPDRE